MPPPTTSSPLVQHHRLAAGHPALVAGRTAPPRGRYRRPRRRAARGAPWALHWAAIDELGPEPGARRPTPPAPAPPPPHSRSLARPDAHRGRGNVDVDGVAGLSPAGQAEAAPLADGDELDGVDLSRRRARPRRRRGPVAGPCARPGTPAGRGWR